MPAIHDIADMSGRSVQAVCAMAEKVRRKDRKALRQAIKESASDMALMPNLPPPAISRLMAGNARICRPRMGD